MAESMSFGFLYDFRNPEKWQRPFASLYAEALDFAAWSEEIGFGGAWVPEHHQTEDGYTPSPLIALAAIAARTKRMKLGTGVALAPFYHPVRFAEDCAVLDLISGGRLEVALALGYRRREIDAYGADFSTRPSRMEEFLQIIRRLWAGEHFSFTGKHFDLKNASITPLPANPAIRLFAGAYSEKAMTRVAKYADGYYGAYELYGVYAEKLRACSKDPASGHFYQASLPLVVARDPEQALHELAPYYYYGNNMYSIWLNEDGFDGQVQVDAVPRAMTLEEYKTSSLLQIFTPQQAVAFFKTMRAKTPVEHATIMVPPGIPLEKFAPYAELFAAEVIPAFR